MQQRDLEIFERQARLCSVMANAKRLQILETLEAGEISVGAIAETLGCSISSASQHLRLMRDEGIVASRKDGQTVYYHLSAPKLVECCHMVREVLIEALREQGRMAEDFDAAGRAVR
jgi:DNA-binding transcriptional ArsR family regulator